jgi:hypothetical protein
MRTFIVLPVILTILRSYGVAQLQDARELTPRQAFDDPRPVMSKHKPPIQKTQGLKSQRNSDPSEPQPSAHAPLVLRYSIQKRIADDKYAEVDPNTIFHSGDRIRINVQANDSAYLYIAQSGSSGSWKILFPSEEAGNDNHVERYRSYTLPSVNSWKFNNQSGQERIFIVLSRIPENKLDVLIYGSNEKEGPPTERTTLAAKVMPIDDSMMARLRSELTPRDLVFEKEEVNERTNDHIDRKENATYVVDANRSGDSPVIVDLILTHR